MMTNESGLSDFRRVYEAHSQDILAEGMRCALEHPEFGPAMQNMDQEQFALQNRHGHELLLACLAGDRGPYEEHLRRQGFAFATMGVSFRGWYDLVTASARPIGPLLLAAYESEPRRLAGALLAWQTFQGMVLATVGEGYLLGMENVRKGQEMFRGLLEAAPDAIVITDENGTIRIINAQTERLFGYSRDELIGQPVEVFVPERYRGRHPAHRTNFMGEPRVRAMGSGLELFGRRKDGSEFPVEISLSPLQTEEGILVSSAIRDISDRKANEKAREDAWRQVEVLNQALEKRAAELEVINRELESFSYSVSHDLRGPLRALDGFSKALTDKYMDQPLDERGKDYLERIRRASQRMGVLIDDLLKLSRITRVELNSQDVDLGDLAGRIALELQEAQPHRKVTFVVADGMLVHADPHLMEIALSNLMNNAWKFTSKVPEARIEVGLQMVQNQPTYFVRDNGAGFDMKYVGQLFGAFQRLHSAAEFEGTGIGLAIVQRVIIRHGGRVWAESAVGEGATFYFTIEPKRQLALSKPA